ncbi:prephenate dehydrogenase [Yimella sp. cx-573]|nr:prephenate dehydrogenase [Yimella sp. cx-573]
MSGLRFADLDEWRRWSNAQHRTQSVLRAAKARLRPAPVAPATLHLPSGTPRTLVVLDLLSPSCRFAVHAPLHHLDPETTAVLSPVPDPDLPTGSWTATPWAGVAQLDSSIEQVLSLGSYLELSGQVKRWATGRDVRFNVVQHGLLTPWSPPAADGDHLLAWTQEDADYWQHACRSVTAQVVGSQMLWNATQLPAATVHDERPVMLGQLHGVELAKRDTFATYLRFCRANDASYRAHPNERDVFSRAAHRVMRRAGIDFEASGRSLTDLGRPVVSIFSTGTLEAAHRGLPAWVTHPNPPAWVADFWDRYRLSQFGREPTSAWHQPGVEPALVVARALTG